MTHHCNNLLRPAAIILLAILAACNQGGPAADTTSIEGEFQMIAAGHSHTCALTRTGGVQCWGSNTGGSLGVGESVSGTDTPTPVPGLETGITSISVGYNNTCVLTTDGAVKCWGGNNDHSLGLGSSITRHQPTNSIHLPTDVPGLSSGIAAIATSFRTSCAITTSGALSCTGSGAGNGSQYIATTFTPVAAAGEGVASVALGDLHRCLLKTDGKVLCWGSNSDGQLGIGGATDYYDGRDTPTAVTGLSSEVSAITVGGDHTCSLTRAGGVQCWGANKYGQLGDGGTTASSSPVDVHGLQSDVTAISAGGSHTCALLRNGSLKCWGRNDYGQLGIPRGEGDSIERRPIAVPGLRYVASVSAGHTHTCIVARNGSARGWGDNGTGQLGSRKQ